MSELINLYIYYTAMEERYYNTDWENEMNYVKYNQFHWLSHAVLREIEALYV